MITLLHSLVFDFWFSMAEAGGAEQTEKDAACVLICVTAEEISFDGISKLSQLDDMLMTSFGSCLQFTAGPFRLLAGTFSAVC